MTLGVAQEAEQEPLQGEHINFACRFFLGNWNQAGFLAEGRPTRTLREMLTRLRETYCASTGYEVNPCTIFLCV